MSKEKSVKKYEMDMCSGPILKKMLLFSLPLMCSSILQLLFNAADIIVVGNFAGDNSLAAVGANTALINLMVNFFMGFSVGANVLVAGYYGAKRDEDLSKTIHTAITLSIYSGVILTVIGVVFAKQLIIMMQTPLEVIGLASTYLRIYFCGMTATMLYNFGSAILRAIGDTKRPLYYLLFSGIINVILNLIFVIPLKMDVAGVALATVISQCISAFLVISCMIREKGSIHLDIKMLGIDKDKFIRILQIGLPASFQGIIFSLSNVVIQSSVNSFGKVAVAGNSAAANIEGFVYVAMNTFHQSAISFTSQNIGAAKYERVNRILYTAEACVLVVGLLLGNLASLLGRHLLGLYTSSAEVIDSGLKRLNIICRTYALCGMMDVIVGSLRGMGYSVVPMIVSLIGACGLRLVWIFTMFQAEPFHSLTGLYITYPVSWLITFLAHSVCFMVIRKKLKHTWGI